MTPNNNLSVLPWYQTIGEQNARKWWVYGRQYPLFAPSTKLLPFQIILSEPISMEDAQFILQKSDGTTVGDYSALFQSAGIYQDIFDGYAVLSFCADNPVFAIPNGQYFLSFGNGEDTIAVSEVFTVVEDITPYLKIEWYDREDMIMDGTRIVYQLTSGGTQKQFKNVLYLKADIAKPEYIFEEEGETRDGYFFPIKQISEKKYRFSFLASEYLLDVMRFIRMADFATITKNGQTYNVDSFLITPKWENNGDVAAVDAEFETATVAKKIGTGYIRNA